MALPRYLKVRFTGPAGPPVVSDFSGIARLVARARPHYDPISTEHEMLDRSVQQDRYGYRVSVELIAKFTPGSAGDALIAAAAALVEDDSQLIDLTLDGDQATPTWRRGFFRAWQVLPDSDRAMAATYWALNALFVCEAILQVGTVGDLLQPGQPGHYDVPFPTSVTGW